MSTSRDRSSAARPRRASGFSLVELVAVMVIISILAVSAAPAISNAAAVRRTSVASAMLRDIAYARQRAVATGTVHWVDLAGAPAGYTILTEDPASPGFAGAAPLNDPATGKPFSVTLAHEAPGLTITSVSVTSDRFAFDWLGRPLDASGNALTVSAEIDLSSGVTIVVAPRTGHAWIESP